ncbi:MAG TPA: hypothetical protein VE860_21745 [Chthoniobacterales bacterium]|jgi:ribose/xylose/arabinose/galactoside ABC-type transport system permease subunit|nr:hypothetical protein [Chthoniobacterales bacterium]
MTLACIAHKSLQIRAPKAFRGRDYQYPPGKAFAFHAAVLGGCHLAGGRISLIGTLFGAFMLRGIQSFLIILAVQPQWYILVVGLIVALASMADRALTRFALRR